MKKKHVLSACAVAAVFIACSCLLVQSCPELRPLCTHQAQLKAEWKLLNTQDALLFPFPHFTPLFWFLFFPLSRYSRFSFHSVKKNICFSVFSHPVWLCLSLRASLFLRKHLISIYMQGLYRGKGKGGQLWWSVNLSASIYIPLLKPLCYYKKVVKLLVLRCFVYLCSGLWFGVWPLEQSSTRNSISHLNNSDA